MPRHATRVYVYQYNRKTKKSQKEVKTKMDDFARLLTENVYMKSSAMPLVSFDHSRQDAVNTALEVSAEIQLAMQHGATDLGIYPNPRAAKKIFTGENMPVAYHVKGYTAADIMQLRVMVVDLDGDTTTGAEKVARAQEIAKANNLPAITGALHTSRNHVTLLWAINSAPLIATYNRIAYHLATLFSELGADYNATADKMLRLPGSINTKTGDPVSYQRLESSKRITRTSKLSSFIMNEHKYSTGDSTKPTHKARKAPKAIAGSYDLFNAKAMKALHSLFIERGGVSEGMRNVAYRQAASLYTWTSESHRTAAMSEQLEYIAGQVENQREAGYTFKKAMQDAATNGAKPFNKAKLAAMLEITPDECQRWPILDPNKRSHKRTHKAKQRRRVQITESTARIAQVARERGIFAIVTMSTRELSAAMFSDGRDHRKVAGRARKALLDESRKHAAETLRRGAVAIIQNEGTQYSGRVYCGGYVLTVAGKGLTLAKGNRPQRHPKAPPIYHSRPGINWQKCKRPKHLEPQGLEPYTSKTP
ncbi:Hypothetical protein UCCLBBS449_pH0002 (plasmid) [Levilactobacillus brevis]|uniref:Uncharacterized protein n=2 Tax=Levilactobacillus brevis TaxID=1580 RepID=A0A5B7Y3M4_LEVBR|nr:Hypothetical protein UCCLBBS449_pH0002 [Levilactobacillus brevis]